MTLAVDSVNARRLALMLQKDMAHLVGAKNTVPAREALTATIDDYLGELRKRGGLNDYGCRPWGAPHTPITVKDDRPRKTHDKVHWAIYTYAEGKSAKHGFPGLSWRKAKPRIKRALAAEAQMMRVDINIEPTRTLSFFSVEMFVAHKEGKR